MSPEQIAYIITIVMCAVISYNKGLRQGATAMVTELTDTNNQGEPLDLSQVHPELTGTRL